MMANKRTNSILDVPGIEIGHAEDTNVQTGATVIVPPNRSPAGVVVLGGGPGTRETDILRQGTLVDGVDAIVLSGGSVYGLAAADGVAAQMGAEGRGFGLVEKPGVPRSPIVPAAILYDLANGGDKDWGAYPPYQDLGRQAWKTRSATCPLGRVGAGYGARAGLLQGAIGTASDVTEAGLQVGAIVAVNSFGSVRMPDSDAYWAWDVEENDEYGGARPPKDYRLHGDAWKRHLKDPGPRENTTLACIATDGDFSKDECYRIAGIALSGLATAIRPVFTPFDGDVVFALATGTRKAADRLPQRMMDLTDVGVLGARVLARAIARGVHAANPPAI